MTFTGRFQQVEPFGRQLKTPQNYLTFDCKQLKQPCCRVDRRISIAVTTKSAPMQRGNQNSRSGVILVLWMALNGVSVDESTRSDLPLKIAHTRRVSRMQWSVGACVYRIKIFFRMDVQRRAIPIHWHPREEQTSRAYPCCESCYVRSDQRDFSSLLVLPIGASLWQYSKGKPLGRKTASFFEIACLTLSAVSAFILFVSVNPSYFVAKHKLLDWSPFLSRLHFPSEIHCNQDTPTTFSDCFPTHQNVPACC